MVTKNSRSPMFEFLLFNLRLLVLNPKLGDFVYIGGEEDGKGNLGIVTTLQVTTVKKRSV